MSKGFSARRTEYLKSIRAQAHKEGTLFKVALEEAKCTKAAKAVLMGWRIEEPPLSQRNIRQWSSNAVLVDDGDIQIYDEDVYDFKVDFCDVEKKHKTDTNVSLLDLARPAKQKGVAKDFEVIKKSPQGMLLDGEEFEIWEDDSIWEDDWEKIYDEHSVDARRSYSSVLRGNDRGR